MMFWLLYRPDSTRSWATAAKPPGFSEHIGRWSQGHAPEPFGIKWRSAVDESVANNEVYLFWVSKSMLYCFLGQFPSLAGGRVF